MKKQVRSLWFLTALAVFLSVGISLNAQDSTPQTQTPGAQSQPAQTAAPDAQSQTAQTPQAQPSQTPDAAGQAAPDSQAQATQPAGAQSFTGTIVKSGDKYVFQDADTGNTYDIDHQDEVQKFEGKRVKVHGTLDASSKTIHVQ
jgi:Protein of unknown function (DUF5818)